LFMQRLGIRRNQAEILICNAGRCERAFVSVPPHPVIVVVVSDNLTVCTSYLHIRRVRARKIALSASPWTMQRKLSEFGGNCG
jgi:hypothetical protein